MTTVVEAIAFVVYARVLLPKGGLGEEIAGVTTGFSSGDDPAFRFSRYEGDKPYAFAAEEGDIEFELPREESMKRDVRGCSWESGRECAGVT